MSEQEPVTEAVRTRFRRMRRIAACAVVAAMVVALAVFGRGLLGWWSRQMASLQLSAGAIHRAQQWLEWSDWFDPANGAADLLRATSLRLVSQRDQWNAALESARQDGAPAPRIEQERKLGLIQSGLFYEGFEDDLAGLVDAGAPPDQVSEALVHGYLARQDSRRAELVLAAWEKERPQAPQLAYMKGVYWLWISEGEGDIARRQDYLKRAEDHFAGVLSAEPRHEMARTTLAGLLEQEDRLADALEQHVLLMTRSGDRQSATPNIARILRMSGQLDKARAMLEPLALQPSVATEIAEEMGQIELESGRYPEAERWFARAGVDQTENAGLLRGAATAFSVLQQGPSAEKMFARLDAAQNGAVRIDDLRSRLSAGEPDPQAAAELRRLTAQSNSPPAGVSPRSGQLESTAKEPSASGADLYALHCAACHGAQGSGDGRAARHLFPKPRDFRTDKFRLVSTRNGVPTLKDLEGGIKRGMPGTSMRAFDTLSEDDRMLLAREVQRLNREGVVEQFVRAMSSEGETIDDDEVRQVLKLCTTPGEVVSVPRIDAADLQAAAASKEAYARLGCDKCHGPDGTGVWDTPLFDEKGRLAPPRDLVHEPLKGGPEAESIYLRVFLGMPGTPHPACWNAPQDDLVRLVAYCRSLSREPKSALTNHQRALQASSRVYAQAP